MRRAFLRKGAREKLERYSPGQGRRQERAPCAGRMSFAVSRLSAGGGAELGEGADQFVGDLL